MGVLIGFGRRRGGVLGGNLNQQMLMWAGIGLVWFVHAQREQPRSRGLSVTFASARSARLKRTRSDAGSRSHLHSLGLGYSYRGQFRTSVVNMWPQFLRANVCVHCAAFQSVSKHAM